MTKELIATDGTTILVDDEDYPLLSRHSWQIHATGDVIYARTRIKTDRSDNFQSIFLHQFVLAGSCPVKHLNGNPLDYTKVNLRSLSKQQISAANPKFKRPCSSKYKGVTLIKKTGKWLAAISVDGKRRYLGVYDVEDEAGRAYNTSAVELFGPDAWLNPVPVATGSNDEETK